MIERITALVEKLPGASLVVDATGVGRAVLDHMAEPKLWAASACILNVVLPFPLSELARRYTGFVSNLGNEGVIPSDFSSNPVMEMPSSYGGIEAVIGSGLEVFGRVNSA